MQVNQQADQVAMMHSWQASERTADGATADGVPECGVVDGTPPELTRLLCAHVPVERRCQLSRPKAKGHHVLTDLHSQRHALDGKGSLPMPALGVSPDCSKAGKPT